MKRLVLALVSALLLAVFIAFNYLLWEREGREEKLRQLETNNASNSASMNSLSDEIKKLEAENSNLDTSLDQLKNLNLSLQSEVQQLKEERAKIYAEIVDKNLLMDALKKQVNLSAFEGLAKKWTDAIDTQKYDAAYKLEYGWKSSDTSVMSIEEYSAAYKSTVKSLKLKSVSIDTDTTRTASGQLALIITMDVKLADDVDVTKSALENGENKKLFKLKYLGEKEGFAIDTISNIQ